jgi:heat shock protein HslJ
VETAIQVTGTVSLATLQSSVWGLLENVDYGGQRPTLLFEPGQVSGSTGCNRYHGPVVAGETVTSLTIGPLSVTRKVCPEPLIARERDFLRALEEAGFYRFRLGRLVLSGPHASLLFSSSRDREH